MPYFVGDAENDVSVLAQPLPSPGPVSFSKGVSSTISSRPVVGPLASVDTNGFAHGHRGHRGPPPPPSYQPPSPPPTLTDGLYDRHSPYSSDSTSISGLSTASSSPDMNGHGRPGSSSRSHPMRPSSSSSAVSLALSLTQPNRPPPLPPASSSSAPHVSHTPYARQPSPSPPSLPPPPPPKTDSLSRIPKLATNGVPISVPSPLVDRTRVMPEGAAPRLPGLRQHQHLIDDAQTRNSMASTVGSSILSPTGLSASLVSQQQQPQLLQPQQNSPAAPHRFSSPPAYIPGTGGSAPSSSGGPLPPPLKHRHTLEVPKPASTARNSREGVDAATLVSGRFSPTATAGTGSISGSVGGRRASLSLGRKNTRSMHSDMPRDEVVPDEDALRWTEAYRQKRATKKRRLEQDDDQVLVGTKVDETHANWVAAYNMLTGIRVSVSRTNAKLDRPITDEDFEARQKSTFDIAGNELVPSAKYDFKFKDYAPIVFRRLRAMFHLDPADYLMSLAGKYILSELGSPGKSGSFFYFSRDYKYIIKTIHHSEHKFLRKILKEYYQHVSDNPNTLLSQFYGLHRVKVPYGRKIHFVVMNNLFPPHRDIHQTFDLKGSTIGRDYPEERVAGNARATLKDLNWLRRQEHLELGMIKKRLFLEQLQKDVKLLQRLHIMDYSLLVGIHDIRRGNDENLRGKTLQVFEPGTDSNNPDGNNGDPQSVLLRTPSRLEHQRKTRELRQMLKAERPIPIGQSANKMPDELDDNRQSVFYNDSGGFQATHEDNTPSDEVYYLGVIDCLTHYGMVKKIEHFWKGLSQDRNKISALPPQHYGDRFLKFVSGVTMSPEDAAKERAQAAEAEALAAVEAAVGAAEAAAMEAAAANGSGTNVPAIAISSGRDKGKEAAHSGSWASSMRHRNAGPGHRNTEDAEGSASTTAAHRAAEYDALQRGAVASEGMMTKITVTTSGGTLLPGAVGPSGSQQQPVLPIVEEAGEASSIGGQSRHNSRPSSKRSMRSLFAGHRPTSPAKGERSGGENGGSSSNNNNNNNNNGNNTLKPDSADSGYGVSGTRSRSGTVGSNHKAAIQLSRESLDKDLPPLPLLLSGPNGRA
ncbi:hypothetical protein CMQ_5408 [Grosmannia clavigera kw1407]|uniref:1-phosphatidylinositol-4-phosphate 5-kinase n=1 Tax=Grosmannia clavigera (strain kw1407 / UAMH 11150) TaxID=655863 RepID=F0XFZ4_GROCL|nr:uncharacterized protein CMQ_5408 [Grosmannia clavigera kw1407]EFX03358.1 hypothetical protein CMQ_5408 [Grosmannia clavigera kw1407]